jgi:hypothetical protein
MMKSIWAVGAVLSLAGCSMNTGAGPSGDAGEAVGTAQDELVVGPWAGPYSNNNAGPYPVNFKQSDGKTVAVCEGYEPGDGRYHPGKMWGGTCRYEYGGHIVYNGSYYVLQSRWNVNQADYPKHWQSNNQSSTVPSTAIGSNGSTGANATSLPICKTGGGTGKAWLGWCYVEYNGSVTSSQTFDWLLTP